MEKLPFLVVYDYGMGGVWAIIKAIKAAEIMSKYPELTIVEERPEWMAQELYDSIAAKLTFDVDDEPSGWLLSLVQGRKS